MTVATITTDHPLGAFRAQVRSRRSQVLDVACRTNAKRLRRRIARAWRPRPSTPPPKWLAQNMRLDREVEASTGRYNIARRPWWAAILGAIADPEVVSITVPAATQVGKTLALLAAILWMAENAPAPAMLVAPDKDTAIELRDRLYLNAEASIKSGRVRRLRVPRENERNTRYCDLGSMRLYLAWSGSRQRLRGRPCRYVFQTELDVYQTGHKTAGDPVTAAHQRTKAFYRGLHYHESSPSSSPSRVVELERQATARYRWHCPCPHCGLFQELRFFTFTHGTLAGRGGIAGFKDKSGELVSAEAARESAYYVCEAGCRIENDDKQAMLERGCWVPMGCRVKQEGTGKRKRKAESGKPACHETRQCVDKNRYWCGPLDGKPPTSRRKLGFHLWSVHSDSISFGDLAAAYVEHKEKGQLAEFFGNWLGLAFTPDTRVPSWAQLGRRAAWYHARKTVPQEAWFLTAGSDVQGENNGVRVSIRGWAPGRTSWLIDWLWLSRDAGDENDLVKSDLAKLTREVLDRRYPVVGPGGGSAKNPLGRSELAVKLLTIDTGNLPKKVHAWLKGLPPAWVDGEAPRVRPIRGDHQLNPETRWQRSEWEQNVRTGEKYEDGFTVWRLYVYPFYDELTEMLAGTEGLAPRGQGSGDGGQGQLLATSTSHLPRTGGWYLTSDCLTQGRAYLEQVVNFGRGIKVDAKTGAKKAIWGPRNHRTPVDYWDTEIYSLVAAEMVVGDLGWSAAAWEKWKEGLGLGARAGDQAAGKTKPTRRASSRDRDAGRLDDR